MTCVTEQFLARNTKGNLRCAWSGTWDKPENFYEANNGWWVHKGSEIPSEYTNWKPKVTASEAMKITKEAYKETIQHLGGSND